MSFWYFFLPKIGLYWRNLNFLSFSLAKFEIFELFLTKFEFFDPQNSKFMLFEGPRQPKNSIFCVFWRNLYFLTPSTLIFCQQSAKFLIFEGPRQPKKLDFLQKQPKNCEKEVFGEKQPKIAKKLHFLARAEGPRYNTTVN